jgi:hypothetical protein
MWTPFSAKEAPSDKHIGLTAKREHIAGSLLPIIHADASIIFRAASAGRPVKKLPV